MTGKRDALDRWPVEKTVVLTLDLECDYGTALQTNTFEATTKTPQLREFLERHDVPISVFLQSQLLQEAPRAVQSLEDADVPVEFHAHSHTHPKRKNADVSFEVGESVRRIRDRFDTEPVGFRFPDGAAEASDYEVLAEHDVPFNASLFPSWRPGRFNNSSESRFPFRHVPSGVLEIPFTVYSERIRVPVALSYLKLIGALFERLLKWNPPNVVVFDMHMHDLFVPPSYRELPSVYQAIYARHKNDGVQILAEFIGSLKSAGYQFTTMTELHQWIQHALWTGNRSE